MKRIKLLAVFLGFCSVASGQERGYFGKNTVIEIDANGSVPLFQNIFSEKGYVAQGGKLKESYNLFDYGFRAALGTITANNRILAFEYGYRRFQFNPLKEGELNRQYTDLNGNLRTDYINPKVAFLDMQEHIFLPKIVFVNDFSRIPAGFSNEIGIGYTVTTFYNKTPLAEYPQGGAAYNSDSVSGNLIDPDFKSLSGMTFMYGFKMNYPISKSLLFHIGFRYSYSLLFGRKDYKTKELSQYWLSDREIWSRVNQRRQLGIISFSTGFTICF